MSNQRSLRDYINLVEEKQTENFAGKLAGKALPGVGLAMGIADAYDRWKKGDYKGAAISGASGVASLVPGAGTAASVGLDAYNAYRDMPTAEDAEQAQPQADPNLAAFFQELEKMGGTISGQPGQEMVTLPGQQPVPLAQLDQLAEALGLDLLKGAAKYGSNAISASKAALGKLPQLWNNFSRGMKGALPAATQGAGGRFVAPSAANKAAWKAGQVTKKGAKYAGTAGQVTKKGAKYAGTAGAAAGAASLVGDTPQSQTAGTSAKARRTTGQSTAPGSTAPGSTAPRSTAPGSQQAAKPATKKAAGQSLSGAPYGYNSPEEVQQIQSMLGNMGYGVTASGKWDAATDKAYKTAYQQMYGSVPGAPSQADPNAGGGFVTGTAKTGPGGTTSFTNVPQGPQGKPDAWTQAKIAKQGQSADIAAAAGMPNPYVKTGKSLEETEMSRIKDLINYKK